MKQKYLQEIRKRMFWRFKGSDIREVLEELDMYFETAEEEGLTQEQFVARYGAPRDLVREMMETQAIPAKEQSRNLLRKFLGMICAVVLMAVSYFCIGVEAAPWVGIVFLAMLIWSLSVCNYYLGRSKEVSDRKRCKQQVFSSIFRQFISSRFRQSKTSISYSLLFPGIAPWVVLCYLKWKVFISLLKDSRKHRYRLIQFCIILL